MHRIDLNQPFCLNEIKIDPIGNRVICPKRVSSVPHKLIELLQYFAARPGIVVSNEELGKKIWDGFVSEGTRYSQIANLRKILGDDPNQPRFIKTIPRRGYMLIAEVRSEQRGRVDIMPPAHRKSRKIILLVSAVLCLIASFYFTFYYLATTRPSFNVSKHNEFGALLFYPRGTVALEVVGDPAGNSKGKAMLALGDVIAAFHINRENINLIHIEKNPSEYFYGKLLNHYQDVSPLYRLIRIELGKEGDNQLSISIFRATDKKLLFNEKMNFESSESVSAGDILDLDKFIVRILVDSETVSNVNPVQTQRKAVLTGLQEVLLEGDINPLGFPEIFKSVETLARLCDENPDVPLLGYLLFMYYEKIVYAKSWNLNLSRINYLVGKQVSESLKKFPDDSFGLATYALLKCNENQQSCRTSLVDFLKRSSNQSHAYVLITQTYGSGDTIPIELARFLYRLQPFRYNGLAFHYYFEASIEACRFSEAMAVVGSAKFWVHTDYWGLFVRDKTRPDNLRYFQRWYVNDILGRLGGIERAASTPYYPEYIAFSFLNADRPDLADYWAGLGVRNGADKMLEIEIQTLGKFWDGLWNEEEWFNISTIARDHRTEISSLYKMRLAYIDQQANLTLYALDYYRELVPELFQADPDVNSDNIRFAVYLLELFKGTGELEKHINLLYATRKYIAALGDSFERSAYFGLSDVQFYALNNDAQTAMHLLGIAIKEQHWLPSAYWLWPPISNDPFLHNLYRLPEFKELSDMQREYLAQYCFEKGCL